MSINRRLTSGLIAIIMMMFIMMFSAQDALAGTGRTMITGEVTRLAGSNRYETAVAISNAGWSLGSGSVIITNGEKFPDALAGVPLSKIIDAPILLVKQNELPLSTEMEIARLSATTAYILGGEFSVSKDIYDELVNNGMIVVRISGSNRYSTAVKIGEKMRALQTTTPTINAAVLCNGDIFADALSMGPLAAMQGWPMLFTKAGSLNATTKQALIDFGITDVFIAGGTSAVSGAVSAELVVMGLTVKRLDGANRYITSSNIIRNMMDREGEKITGMLIATGNNFPDALAGGALAAKLGMPIGLVGSSVSSQLIAILGESAFKDVRMLGGVLVLPVVLENDITPWMSGEYGNANGNLAGQGMVTPVGGYSYYYKILYSEVMKSYENDTPTTLIPSSASGLNVYDRYIYYVDGTSNTLYRKMLYGNNAGSQFSNIRVGYVYIYNGYIYFSNYDDSRRIYRMNIKTKVVTQLSTHVPAFLSVDGDFIYYVNGADKLVYRMKLDGSNPNPITTFKVGNRLVVSDNYVYVINTDANNNLYRMGIDGSGATSFIGRFPKTFNVSNGYVYYTDKTTDALYRADSVTGLGDVLLSNAKVLYPAVAGDWIYYIRLTDSEICRVKTDGTNEQVAP